MPAHVPAIPESLRNAPDADGVYRATYRSAVAVCHRYRGPDSRRSFDIETGKVAADP